MTTIKVDLFPKLLAIAQAIAAADPARLRLAVHECDDTTLPEPEAATFLKVNEKRLGRDIELYGKLMAKVAGVQEIAVMFLEEIVLPLQVTTPAGYRVGLEQLRTLDFFEENQAAWVEMIDGFLK